VEHFLIASADHASLRQELREVFPIENRHEIDGFALQRERQPEDRYEVGRPAAALQLTDASLREATPVRNLHLRKPALLPQLAQMISEDLTSAPLHRHSQSFALTNRTNEYTILLVTQERIFMLNPNLTERIRSIFLHDEPRVTVAGAARLLGRSVDDITTAIADGDVETISTGSGPMIDMREIAEQALHAWPLVTIEAALGTEATLILPPGVRTRKFTARLPRYIIAALQRLAEENCESVEALLTRELHGLAYTNKDRLAAAIPGFAEAIDWPLSDDAKQAC
jgi:hypothetical protein